jgi:hypothetical protein
MQMRNEMNTTIKPQSANKKEIKMNTQSDKNKEPKIITKFFGVAIWGQTYLNLLYLLLAFPLGLFYFVLLVTGFSLGFGLLILWVGVIILVGMLVAWWDVLFSSAK